MLYVLFYVLVLYILGFIDSLSVPVCHPKAVGFQRVTQRTIVLSNRLAGLISLPPSFIVGHATLIGNLEFTAVNTVHVCAWVCPQQQQQQQPQKYAQLSKLVSLETSWDAKWPRMVTPKNSSTSASVSGDVYSYYYDMIRDSER